MYSCSMKGTSDGYIPFPDKYLTFFDIHNSENNLKVKMILSVR